MECIYTELALYGSINECARNDNVFFLISEVCDGTVSLVIKVDKQFCLLVEFHQRGSATNKATLFYSL